jgi:membrane associated rhomboid family serine protease
LLIGINVAVFFFLQPMDDEQAEIDFAYERAVIACEVTTGEPLTDAQIQGGCDATGGSPEFPDKNVYAASVISMFLHGGIIHLLANMWFLWIFGNNIEEAFGRVAYLVLYLAAGMAATGAFIVANPDAVVPLVGASGAIAGVLGAYTILFPTHRILSLVFIVFVPVPAVVFLGIWFFMQFAVDQPGVAWEAHVVGFLFGMAAAAVFRTRLFRRLTRLHDPLGSHPRTT